MTLGATSEQSNQDVESLCLWAIFNVAFILSLQFGLISSHMLTLVLFILPVADQFSSSMARTY